MPEYIEILQGFALVVSGWLLKSLYNFIKRKFNVTKIYRNKVDSINLALEKCAIEKKIDNYELHRDKRYDNTVDEENETDKGKLK